MTQHPEEGWHGEAITYTIEALEKAEELLYELRNCVRGSHATRGTENEDLVQEIQNIVQKLEDCIQDIENMPSQASQDEQNTEEETC